MSKETQAEVRAQDSSTLERDQDTPAKAGAGVSYTTTPSGIEIEFTYEGHKYRIRGTSTVVEHPLDESLLRWVEPDWIEVPSASTVTDVLAKNLSWWAMRMGVEGVLELFKRDKLKFALDGPVVANGTELVGATADDVVDLLTAEKLTVNHIRNRAGDRGTAAHNALEHWARHGELADVSLFPEEYRGYITGVNRFIQDSGIIPDAVEVAVASLKHRVAGRYDLRAHTEKEAQVCEHVTEKLRKERYVTLPVASYLIDLKTSKDVYMDSQARQLEGYEVMSIESGYEPTDFRAILNVTRDGYYKFVPSRATGQHFLNTLAVWHDNQEIKKKGKKK